MSDEPKKRSRLRLGAMDFPDFLAPYMIRAAIEAFVECVISRITGKPQFVIQVGLRNGQTGWAAPTTTGSAIELAPRESAAVFRSRFTAAVALSNISRSPGEIVRAKVEQVR
jgi:hypothetical protein